MTNSSWHHKGLTVLAAVTGVTALFIGGAALKWYIWDIAIQQAAEPDRSMLFWGIPIAFIGLAATATGTTLLWLARRRRSSVQPRQPD